MRAFLKICNRQLSHYTVSNNFLRKKSIITQGFVVVDPLEAFYCGFLTIFWPRCRASLALRLFRGKIIFTQRVHCLRKFVFRKQNTLQCRCTVRLQYSSTSLDNLFVRFVFIIFDTQQGFLYIFTTSSYIRGGGRSKCFLSSRVSKQKLTSD